MGRFGFRGGLERGLGLENKGCEFRGAIDGSRSSVLIPIAAGLGSLELIHVNLDGLAVEDSGSDGWPEIILSVVDLEGLARRKNGIERDGDRGLMIPIIEGDMSAMGIIGVGSHEDFGTGG